MLNATVNPVAPFTVHVATPRYDPSTDAILGTRYAPAHLYRFHLKDAAMAVATILNMNTTDDEKVFVVMDAKHDIVINHAPPLYVPTNDDDILF